MTRSRVVAALAVALSLYSTAAVRADNALSVVVMDPLSAPLSCPCVEGYAQRKYEALAEHLEAKLKRPVRLTFSESLKTALRGGAKGRADLIIGKHSVVLADAKTVDLTVSPLAALTGKNGLTTQTGLIVVPAGDPARKVTDLTGYRVLFGPADCDEKHAAAVQLLKAAQVQLPAKLETSQACSDGATKVLELGAAVRSAAVISSYAQPLLQGCGTIKKGDLRVIGETKPVPFVTAFVGAQVDPATQSAISDALLEVINHPQLCAKLESLLGFLPPTPAPGPAKKK